MAILLHNILKLRYHKCLWLFFMGLIILFSTNTSYAFDSSVYAKSSVLSSGKWVRVKITENGLYQISQSDLSKYGFSKLSDIRVFGYGGAPISDVLSLDNYIDDLPQISILRNENKIVFYGQSQESWNKITGTTFSTFYRQEQHPYSQAGYYFITENSEIPDKVVEKTTTTNAGGTPETTFTERMFYEKELYSPGQTGRLLLGEDFKYSSTQNFKFTLTDYVPGTDVEVLTAFAARVLNGTSSLDFKYNGTNLSKTSTDYIRPATSTYEHVKTTETSKTFQLSDANLTYNIGFTYTGTLITARLDYITVNYTRQLALSGGKLLFRGDSKEGYKISGADANTNVWNITKPYSPVGISTNADGVFYPIDNTLSEYVAFNESTTFSSPQFVESVSAQNLHSEEVPNMVIITPTEFKAQADRIAELHKTKDKMSVLVVTPQTIYNEFSSGTPDINGYRKLLKMFWDKGSQLPDSAKLGYLLLFGRGTYDNRQITDKLKTSSYPMLLNWQTLRGDDENSSYNTDDNLGFLLDNSGQYMASDKLCIGIGRMPVKSVLEAKNMVDKLYSYVNNSGSGSWKNNVLMIADDEDRGVHMQQSEADLSSMKKFGGSQYVYSHIYTDAFAAASEGGGRSYPDARNQMFKKLSEGAIWVNYVGHANPVSWTHDGLLNITDMNERLFYKHYPLLYTATCEFTRWDADDVSGGELWFLNTRGGAIALMSPTRVVYISDNGVLNEYVSRYAFRRDSKGNYMRLGDIMKNGKNTYTSSNDNKLRYFLIGDPAMRLVYPNYEVRLETINGGAIDSNNQPTIEARSTVEIAGSVYTPTGEKSTDFNGVISPTLFDSEISVVTNGYGNGINYVFQDRSNKLFIGQDSIKNGEFKMKFNMPSEILNNYSPAMFNFYAYSNDGREGNGSNENLYVYGYKDVEVKDTIGPQISSIFLNSSNFKNGDNVNESPMLCAAFSDESGINVSTSGIGHQMSVTLDGTTTYTDVVQYYTPNTGESTGGVINYPMSSLSAGNHQLRFKVWDTFNNSSEALVDFNVITGLKPELYEVYTTATPASVEANFYLKHNRPDATITVTITVYDLMGKEVWSETETGKSDMFTSFPITWNLTDNAGRRVSRGIYLYRAAISTDGVQESTKSKKIAVAAEQ